MENFYTPSIHPNKWVNYLLISIGLLFLISMLTYPMGYDQAVFSAGGEMTIKNGAITYRDYIDTKPPIIFFIYGLSSEIFGHHEYSIHAFDLIFHILTLIYFYKVLNRCFGNNQLSLYSCLLYVLFYVTSDFAMVCQAESFAFLPSLVIFDKTSRISNNNSSALAGFYTGVAACALFLLKFTLLTVSGGALLFVILNKSINSKTAFKFITSHLITYIGLISFYLIFLWYTGSLQWFIDSLKWLQGYGTLHAGNLPNIKTEVHFKMYPESLLIAFGLTGIITLCVGGIRIIKKHSTSASGFFFLGIQLLFGLMGVFYERKSIDYHYTRLYWMATPIIAYGLIHIFSLTRLLLLNWASIQFAQRILRYSLLIGALGIFTLYSPLVRISKVPIHWVYTWASGKEISQEAHNVRPDMYNNDAKRVANTLQSFLTERDNIFLFGNTMMVYFYTNKIPTTNCLTNAPFITPWTIPSWKKDLINRLKTSTPKFFIAETDDARPFANDEYADSWQLLQQWPELKSFVETNYTERPTIGHFRIFERK